MCVCVSVGRKMSIEAEVLLQEAKESIEAAQNYRSELQQRLHGLSQARKQVLRPICCYTDLHINVDRIDMHWRQLR